MTFRPTLPHQPDIKVTEYSASSPTLSPEKTDQTVLTPPESVADSSKNAAHKPNLGSRLKGRWWLIPAVGIVIAIGGLTAVRIQQTRSQDIEASTPAPLTVRSAIAQSAPIQAWTSSEGIVEAVRFKYLTFDVAGDVTYLAEREGRNLREGDTVTAGELLAQIDDRSLQADVNQAQAAVNEAMRQRGAAAASVAQAESQVAQARAQVAQTQAQLNQAESAQNLAQTESQRYQQLFSQGAISASELDNRLSTLQDSAAQVQAAQAQVSAAQAQVSTAQAQVLSAQEQLRATDSQIETARARLQQAQVALEGTRLYAPFDGIVAYLNIRESENYAPQGAQNDPGEVPIVVVDPSQYEVIADFAAYRGERIAPGQTTLVQDGQVNSAVSAQPSDDLLSRADAQGEVYSVNPAVSPDGRSIEVTSRISSGGANLRHGENITLWVAIAEAEDAVTVPLSAVVYREQQPYVFVINEQTNQVEQRLVEIGIEGLNERQILSGVTVGEEVVTEGQNRLVDGATVQVAQESSFNENGLSESSVGTAEGSQ
ncbi:MAG: efflux RND transporter periplasmic adaptor subunit [Cyanobacteria bacterium J06623_4]